MTAQHIFLVLVTFFSLFLGVIWERNTWLNIFLKISFFWVAAGNFAILLGKL